MMIDGTVYPVEVKDGPSGKLRSLHIYRDTYQPSWSAVFHAGKTGVLKNEKIVFLPLYFAGAFTHFGIDNNLFDVYGENLKIIATGSSAFYIDDKFKDSLAGRKRVFEIKLNCLNLNSTSKKKFTENYPGYRFQGVSYTLNDECEWVLKL